MIEYIEGSIFDTDCDIIIHQVNCKSRMGSGIAYEIRKRYPKAYTSYKKYCDRLGNKLLGKIQPVDCGDIIIINMFGQDNYGRDKALYTDYDAFEECMKKTLIYCEVGNYSIAIPYRIGCRLAGGDWNIVKKIIENKFKKSDVICKIYKKDG